MSRRSHDAIAARLSRDIYLDRVPFEQACVRDGLMPSKWFDHRGTQAALVCGAGAAWLVFRGTEASQFRLLDIVANLKVLPRPWSGEGWVHGGYADVLERVRYKARRMADHVASTVPLYVTGHSLGGAAATLYAAWVSSDREDGHRLAGLTTFGAPKAGSRRALVSVVERMRVFRYVMPLDPAPTWPLALYGHPGPAIVLQPRSAWPGPVRRHSVDGYAAALEELAAGATRQSG